MSTIPLPVLVVIAFAADAAFANDCACELCAAAECTVACTVACSAYGSPGARTDHAALSSGRETLCDACDADLDQHVAAWQADAVAAFDASAEASDGAMSLWRDALDADPALDQTLPWEHERAPMLPPAPQRRPPVRVSRGVVLPAPIGAEVA